MGSECFGVATEHDLYKKYIRGNDLRIDFEMLKVKVPINFLGTVGFSLRRDGRYCELLLTLCEPQRSRL
jgi:hypothetical protein